MQKKFLVGLFAIIMCLTLVGCGSKNEVVCTKKSTIEDGKSYTEEERFELDKDNKVVSASAVYTFDDEETAKSNCDMLKSFFPNYVDLVTCSGLKITIKDLQKIEEAEEDEEKIFGITKDELIRIEEEDGYSCK